MGTDQTLTLAILRYVAERPVDYPIRGVEVTSYDDVTVRLCMQAMNDRGLIDAIVLHPSQVKTRGPCYIVWGITQTGRKMLANAGSLPHARYRGRRRRHRRGA